ncbi:unnamed protein product [Rotaria sp. Silwood2]|nr:unnamed protein product [Rotaria sp. Silwood2]
MEYVNGVTSFDTHAFGKTHPSVWSTCEGLPSEEQNYTVSCCTLQVPLNYAQPNQSSILISMVRLSPSNPNNNSLFVLNSGPDESGLGLVSVINQLIPIEYGITIIFPDHRGAGFSNPLGCDNQNSQIIIMNYIEYLRDRWTVEELNQFSTTSATHDLAIQIEASQSMGRKTILGVSYDIYPNLVESTVMDSSLNPLLHAFTMYHIRAASVAWQFLTYCHYQIEFFKYLPNDPPAIMLYKILQEIDSDNQTSANYYDRTVIPAVIYRLNLCNKEDVAALYFCFKAQGLSSASSSNESSSSDVNSPVLNSDALYYNIAFSELWLYFIQSDIDQQTLNALQNSLIIAPDLRSDLVVLKEKYPLNEYHYIIANSSVLMITAQLDDATPLDLASHLASITEKTRTVYTIPLSGHIIQLYLTVTGYVCPPHLMLF